MFLQAIVLASCLKTVISTPNAFKLDFERRVLDQPQFAKRQLGLTLAQLPTNTLGYVVKVSIGTPPQSFVVSVDTGSSDFWVPSAADTQCQKATKCIGGSFDANKSSTYDLVSSGDFEISYGTGTASGDYFMDTVHLGRATVQNMTMGLVNHFADSPTQGIGLIGVGYPLGESIAAQQGKVNETTPTIYDQLASLGYISRRAFSLYLNDLVSNTGSILFGALDTSRYTGELVTLPVQQFQSAYSRYTVVLNSVAINDKSGVQQVSASNFSTYALLDSGSALTALPEDVANSIFKGLGSYSAQGRQYVPCSYRDLNDSITYTLGGAGGVNITVPFSELIIPASDGNLTSSVGGELLCGLLIETTTAAGNPSQLAILGDSFLRSAYVVYDVENNQIALAQANYGSEAANIQIIPSGTGLPGVSSTAAATIPATVGNALTSYLTGTASGDLGASSSATASSSVPTSAGMISVAAASPTLNLGSANTASSVPTSPSAAAAGAGTIHVGAATCWELGLAGLLAAVILL